MDGYLADICDGSAYKQHHLFSVRSNCLGILLYYDDLELCNPLSSRTKLGSHVRVCVCVCARVYTCIYVHVYSFR